MERFLSKRNRAQALEIILHKILIWGRESHRGKKKE